MDDYIQQIEASLEKQTRYISNLRNKYEDKEKFSIFFEILKKRFLISRLTSLSDKKDIIYFIFQKEFRRLLDQLYKEYMNFLVGKKEEFEYFLDKFETDVAKYIEYYAQASGDIYLIEVAIRKYYLQKVKDKDINRFLSRLNLIFGVIRKILKKSIADEHISRYLERSLYSKERIDNLGWDSFRKNKKDIWIVDFFEEFEDLFFDWSEISLQENHSNEYVEEPPDAKQIFENVKKQLEKVLTNIDSNDAEVVIDNLNRIESSIKIGKGILRGVFKVEPSKNRSEKVKLPRILNYVGEDIKEKLKSRKEIILNKLEEKKFRGIPADLFRRKMFIKTLDFDKFRERIENFYYNTFEPTVYHKIFESMIRIWPDGDFKNLCKDEARWIGMKAREGAVLSFPDLKLHKKERIHFDFWQIARAVTILVYDIRGSTFMGEKLHSAEKEEGIRKHFQKQLIDIALKYGGFPVKDTGDGGIVLFSKNSHILYMDFNRYRLGDKVPEDFTLKPSLDSPVRAVLCAKDMILEAEKFVKDNLKNYEDWFKEVKERKIEFHGISYDKLPPEFKKIFQIGIGIATGQQGVDISFGINAFGEPDVTGNLVRNANLYSKAKDPNQSVIIADARTIYSFLFSLADFEPITDSGSFKGSDPDNIEKKLVKEIKEWYNGFDGQYRVKKYGVDISRIAAKINGIKGAQIDETHIPEKRVIIKSEKEIFDTKAGKIKIFYQILPEGG